MPECTLLVTLHNTYFTSFFGGPITLISFRIQHFLQSLFIPWIFLFTFFSVYSIKYNISLFISFFHIRFDLKTAYTKARKKYEKENVLGMDLGEFFSSFKKGSCKFRMILGYEKKTYDLTKLTQVNTFARITNTTVPAIERLKICMVCGEKVSCSMILEFSYSNTTTIY